MIFLPTKESIGNVSRPRLSGKVAALAVGRGKYEQTHKRVSYRTVLNTCPSFLNGMKKAVGNIFIKSMGKSEESGQRLQLSNVFSIILCRILR